MKKFNNLSEALKALDRAVEVFALISSSDDYYLVEGASEALRYIREQLRCTDGPVQQQESAPEPVLEPAPEPVPKPTPKENKGKSLVIRISID
jgi:hypothetical protein